MNILKRFLLVILGGVLFMSLISAAWTQVGVNTFGDRTTVKGWLEQSDFYDQIVSVVLENANNEHRQNQQLPLQDTQIQAIAKNAFPPDFLRSNIETIIDSTYDWIEGDAATLAFSLDLRDAKNKFADGIAQYAVDRAQSLPICSAEQAQGMNIGKYDILSVSCVPAGTNISVLAASLKQDIVLNESIPQEIAVNSEGIQLGDKVFDLNDNDQRDRVKLAYQLAHRAPVVLGIIALLSTIGMILLSTRRRSGFLKAGLVYISAAVTLAIGYGIFKAFSGALDGKIVEKNSNNPASLELVQRIVSVVSKDIYTPLLWYAVGCGVISACLIGAYVHMGKQTSDDTPQTPTDNRPGHLTEQETPTDTASEKTSDEGPKIQL